MVRSPTLRAPTHIPLIRTVITKEASDVNVDILTKRYFSRVHAEERKGIETVFIAIVANSTVVFGGRWREEQASGP
jgi:hypothetical protein